MWKTTDRHSAAVPLLCGGGSRSGGRETRVISWCRGKGSERRREELPGRARGPHGPSWPSQAASCVEVDSRRPTGRLWPNTQHLMTCIVCSCLRAAVVELNLEAES